MLRFTGIVALADRETTHRVEGASLKELGLDAELPEAVFLEMGANWEGPFDLSKIAVDDTGIDRVSSLVPKGYVDIVKASSLGIIARLRPMHRSAMAPQRISNASDSRAARPFLFPELTSASTYITARLGCMCTLARIGLILPHKLIDERITRPG